MIDDDIARLLKAGSGSEVDFDLAMLPGMRRGMAEAGAALPAPMVTVEAHSADETPLRLYRPAQGRGAVLPLLVFLHGGGWMLGDLDTHDALCRLLSARAGCAILAVGYRLAPEHPFPAALNDAIAAYRWATANAEALGCDGDRIAIGGESAGANIAAAMTIALRDGNEPLPAFQFLVHPPTDLTLGRPSIDEVALPGMTRSFLTSAVRCYVGDRDPTDPLMSPLHCPDLSGLPPALIYTVEIDPLRDDGEEYALALARAGSEVLLRRLPGLPHGFMFLPVTIAAVDRAFDLLADRLAAYFARG